MIKNVIFDLDGTLLDTSEGIVEGIEYAIKQMGWQELPHQDLLSFVGPPPQKSFMIECGCAEDDAQKATEIFREYYSKHSMLKAKPYEGIYEACEQFQAHGIKMAVATNKREDLARSILKHFHFEYYCNPIHGSNSTGNLSKSDLVKMCMDELNAESDETVLIGDTNGDAEGAMKASCKFIAVTWGFGFGQKEDPTKYPCLTVIDKPGDLIKGILI